MVMPEEQQFHFNQEEKSYFQTVGISAIVLFGSRATGTARENSDFDIGILVSDYSLLKHGAKRTQVYEKLYDIFSGHIQKLVNIDIVFLQNASGELKNHAILRGKTLFESPIGAFAKFKEREMQRYADFAPLRTVFHNAILSRIP